MHILSFATGKATDHMTLKFKIIRVILTRLVLFFRIKESSGWQQVFSSPYLYWAIERVALNAKVVGGPHGDKDKMVAASSESNIILWSIQDGGSGSEIGRRTEQKWNVQSLIWLDLKIIFLCLCEGVFSLGVPVDSLFFIGSQLVATSHTGKVGVWNAVTQHWQVKQFQFDTTFKHIIRVHIWLLHLQYITCTGAGCGAHHKLRHCWLLPLAGL